MLARLTWKMKEKGPRETHLDELLEHLEGSGSPGSRTDDRKHNRTTRFVQPNVTTKYHHNPDNRRNIRLARVPARTRRKVGIEC